MLQAMHEVARQGLMIGKGARWMNKEMPAGCPFSARTMSRTSVP